MTSSGSSDHARRSAQLEVRRRGAYVFFPGKRRTSKGPPSPATQELCYCFHYFGRCFFAASARAVERRTLAPGYSCRHRARLRGRKALSRSPLMIVVGKVQSRS